VGAEEEAKERLVRRWLKRFWKRLQYRWGWRRCHGCRGWHKVRWVKDWVVHPEEPPMFYHYECSGCGARTSTTPSVLSEDAARKLGYKDFAEYAEKNLNVK